MAPTPPAVSATETGYRQVRQGADQCTFVTTKKDPCACYCSDFRKHHEEDEGTASFDDLCLLPGHRASIKLPHSRHVIISTLLAGAYTCCGFVDRGITP